jgi:flagellar protein FlbD
MKLFAAQPRHGNVLATTHLARATRVPGLRRMIQLTRLNNQALIVNCDLIKFVETAPDTVLTLVSGEKILVRENPEEVLERIVAFRRNVLAGEGRREPPRRETTGTKATERPSGGPENG